MERYSNKRGLRRSSTGRFRTTTMADLGLTGTCACGHFLIRVYDGDRDTEHAAGLSPDPRKFRGRCFTCEPRSEAELAQQETALAEAKARTAAFWAKLEPEH